MRDNPRKLVGRAAVTLIVGSLMVVAPVGRATADDGPSVTASGTLDGQYAYPYSEPDPNGDVHIEIGGPHFEQNVLVVDDTVYNRPVIYANIVLQNAGNPSVLTGSATLYFRGWPGDWLTGIGYPYNFETTNLGVGTWTRAMVPGGVVHAKAWEATFTATDLKFCMEGYIQNGVCSVLPEMDFTFRGAGEKDSSHAIVWTGQTPS